ncbi:unnamed protein product [Schistosoma turkestanicum]|nr:unnamed protein product [Schistosoma turkestanicum]
MELTNTNDQSMFNNYSSCQVKKPKQEYQDSPRSTDASSTDYYPQLFDSQLSNNFQPTTTGYSFCTLSSTMTPSASSSSSSPSSSSSSSLPNSTAFTKCLSTSLLPSNSSQSIDYKVNEPNCLVILNICTSGRQYDETGSDEYPIMLLTAKIYNLQQSDQDGAEFQQFIKPCQINYHDLKESNLSKIKQSNIKLENDEIPAQNNHDNNTITDVTMQPNVIDENSNMKMIEPIEECIKVTSVNSEILTEAPLLETALKNFHQWIHDNNLYCFQTDHTTTYDQHQRSSPFECSTSTTAIDSENNNNNNHDNHNNCGAEKMDCDQNPLSFMLLVDGPYGLRLALHPETTTKSIDMTNYSYFYQFIDIRKSFAKFYKLTTIPKTINEMMKYLQIDDDYSPPCLNDQFEESFLFQSQLEKMDNTYEYEYCNSEIQIPANTSTTSTTTATNLLQDHLVYNNTIQESYETNQDCQQFNSKLIELNSQSGHWPKQHCQILVKLIRKMTLDGMQWTEFETVNREYYPAIISKTDTVGDNVVVRARGLPWQATDLEIFQFFSGINIAKGGISLVLSKIGRRNGEALIQFENAEQQNLALRKHKHHVGKRYIEVYAATGSDFISIAGGETQEAINFLAQLTTPSQTLIRMRGLPYTTTPEQIISFFANINCSVQFNADGILFVNKRDGRATGDAFVIFETKTIAEKALENNKQHIGNRYIELFKSTPAEVNQVMNSILNPNCDEQLNCWNNHSTECNSALLTINNNPSVYMPHFTETTNNLLYSDYNLKLLSNQSTIADFTYTPQLISLINSNPSFLNDLPQYPQQQQQQQQQTLSFGLPQNGNSYLQRILSNTNLTNSMTNILPTDSLSHFNSLDVLNNVIGVINTPTIPPPPTTTTAAAANILTSNHQFVTNRPYVRPVATMHPLHTATTIHNNNTNNNNNNNFNSTLLLPRFPINSIPLTINNVNYNVNGSISSSNSSTSSSSNNSYSNISNTNSCHSSNVSTHSITPFTNNLNNHQFIIPDLTNLQLLQIFGPNLMMMVTAAAAATATTMTTTATAATTTNTTTIISATATTTTSNNNTTNNIGISSSSSKNNENLLLSINLSIEEIAKTFVRICGMPIHADITDILIFLQDNWRNVAVHGIHLVYDVTGQPIGEAMIQFVTQLSAQNVCEQKHRNIFIKYGLPIPIGVYVDVIQCTRDDLNQLLLNMSGNIGIFTNNLMSSSTSTSASSASASSPISALTNLMNPIAFTQLHHFDEQNLTSVPPTKSSIPLQSGYGNVFRMKQPEFPFNALIHNKELNHFNVPPPLGPPLPPILTSTLSNYITGMNNTFPLATPLIDTHHNNPITNALIQCTPTLSNMLGFQIPNLIYQTSIPNFFTSNSMLNNNDLTGVLSTSIPYLTSCHNSNNNDNIINNGYNLSEFKKNPDWINSWPNNGHTEQITIMNNPELQIYKTNNLFTAKTDTKPIIVTIQGFPKEMTTSDFTKWLEQKIKNVKILSIQFEHSLLNEMSNGLAKVYLQHYTDAELIVQEFNNTTLNNFRISAQIN